MSDRDLLNQIYAHSLPRLGAFAYALTGSYSAAEELVQAAIVKAFVRRRRLRDIRAAEAYVRAAIRTIHLDGIRRQARWTAAAPVIAEHADVPGPADAVDSDDLVARALATLPPRVRTAIVLYYLDDRPILEIAQSMRISEGTVKGYLKDGRARLASLLGTPDDDDPEVATIKEVR